MFKKLRIRIVAAVMLSILALLAGTLAVILGASYAQMNTDNLRLLEQYAREYQLEAHGDADGAEAKGPTGTDEAPPPLPDEQPPETLHKFDVSTFYAVALADDGTVLRTDAGTGTLYTEETLTAYAREIAAGSAQTSKWKGLTYLQARKAGYTLVAFIDNAILQGGMATVFHHTLLFGGLAVPVVFIIAVFLARRIAAPLEESFRRQKQFVSDAGHELKTPVAVIDANAELLAREIGENRWLANIRYENERMGSLVRQLLELARTEAVAPQTERLELGRLVAGELLPFESVAFEQGLRLRSELAEGVFVEGDPARLKQLTSILIDNAIRHSEKGAEVLAVLKSERGWARLSVLNDGEEIPAEQQRQIFERFYRIDPARSDDGHFGLGLAIARAIAEAHKGKIRLACHDGKIEFCVLLPLAK